MTKCQLIITILSAIMKKISIDIDLHEFSSQRKEKQQRLTYNGKGKKLKKNEHL